MTPETANFEADLEAELQKSMTCDEKTYRRANLRYEIIKLTGEALQKNEKYSQIKEISDITFSNNYISQFALRHGIRAIHGIRKHW